MDTIPSKGLQFVALKLARHGDTFGAFDNVEHYCLDIDTDLGFLNILGLHVININREKKNTKD